MWAVLMHSTHPQRMKQIFPLDFHLTFFVRANTFVDLQGWPLSAVCTCVPQCVYFTTISRLWHSEGTSGQTQDINIWVRELYSLPSVPILRSFAGISPSSVKYLTGDLLYVVTVWWKVEWICDFWRANAQVNVWKIVNLDYTKSVWTNRCGMLGMKRCIRYINWLLTLKGIWRVVSFFVSCKH